jgi:tetratricopeptide (TPR) repeat protein
MARAAAKRRQPVRHDKDRRKHKDSGGQRFEDTLFFNRLRKRAKWVFIFLAVVFAGGFVLFGVGSSNVSGLGDIFNGIGGGGGSGPSVKKELKRTQENPKNAQAWHDLAAAYDTNGEIALAINAWTTYVQLRPKDVEGLTQLATDYAQQFSTQTDAARAAALDAQTAQSSTFGPPSTSPLGKALGAVPDPIEQAVSGGASQRFNDARSAMQVTATQLAGTYGRIAKLQPAEPAAQLQLAQAAQDAGQIDVAVAAYRKFLKLAPFDNQAAYAKQQIKTLESQLAGAPQGKTLRARTESG